MRGGVCVPHIVRGKRGRSAGVWESEGDDPPVVYGRCPDGLPQQQNAGVLRAHGYPGGCETGVGA